MSFNLRRDVADDGHQRWENRRELLAATIRRSAPDVLGTQEGLPHQLAELDARLPTHVRIGRCRAGDDTDEACAIYVSRSRFAILEHGTFWLSQTPDVPASRSWESKHPRIATWARLLDLETGRELTVANTHLDHASQEARENAARLLAARLPGAILMGDLNVAPGETTHTLLLQAGWDDAGATEPTFHGFTGRAWARLDHILAPRQHRIRAVAVVAAEREGVHASDHHGILAEIELIEDRTPDPKRDPRE